MAQRLATQAELEQLYPAAASLDAGLVATFLDLAGEQFDLEVWGDKASYAHALLTAHYLEEQQGKAGGQVTKRKIDGLEVNYAQAGGSDFESTRFGRLFLQVQSTVLVLGVGASRG